MQLSLGVAVGLLVIAGTQAPQAKRPTEPKKDAQSPWAIPEAASARPNPLVASPETLSAGRGLWRDHCLTCHGARGKGDGPNAKLHERRKGYAPRDLTDPNVQENLTDGDIFWRLSKGLKKDDDIIMPSYETKLPEETERWQLVLFVRELGRAAKK
jgi:Cytochrome C oxidase, cbb3-type, subunit III